MKNKEDVVRYFLIALFMVGMACMLITYKPQPINFNLLSNISDATSASVGSEKAIETLQAMGYSNIHPDGPAIVGCLKEDSVLTSINFSATINNMPVRGKVCCGLVVRGCAVYLK